MLISDDNLLTFLNIIGICHSGNSSNLGEKILGILIRLLYGISVFGYASLSFTLVLKHGDKLSAVYIFEAGIALLMWYSLTVRRKKILDALRELFSYRSSYGVENNTSSPAKALIIASQFLMLISYEALIYFFTPD